MPISLPSLISIFAAFAALFGIWVKWRQSELRRHETELRLKEVFQWSNDVITRLATLRLVILKGSYQEAEGLRPGVEKLALDTSVLIEHGRLFFKNTEQGKRPKILDCIVLAHKLALRTAASPETPSREERARMFRLADRCLKDFVRYAQEEVGRQRVVSEAAAAAGQEADLDAWLDEVDRGEATQMLDKWLKTAGASRSARAA